jgi:hypothetical protein
VSQYPPFGESNLGATSSPGRGNDPHFLEARPLATPAQAFRNILKFGYGGEARIAEERSDEDGDLRFGRGARGNRASGARARSSSRTTVQPNRVASRAARAIAYVPRPPSGVNSTRGLKRLERLRRCGRESCPVRRAGVSRCASASNRGGRRFRIESGRGQERGR